MQSAAAGRGGSGCWLPSARRPEGGVVYPWHIGWGPPLLTGRHGRSCAWSAGRAGSSSQAPSSLYVNADKPSQVCLAAVRMFRLEPVEETSSRARQLTQQHPVKCRVMSWLKQVRHDVRVQMSNVNVGAGSYEGDGATSHGEHLDSSATRDSNKPTKPLSGSGYLQSIGAVLLICALAASFFLFFKGQPSAVVSMLAKSGFTAAFSLIFVSEIGDKTFFIAALLAMQYQKILVLLGSMAALSLMTIVSVIIGRIFQSVPAQFQTTLPIGEYAAVALLAFFGFKSIKDALALPDSANGNLEGNSESGELAEAEELVKEKVSNKLTSPLEVLWKSFSLVFFAEWGDRSMLATIALGAAQSPLGVTSGAIAGHLIATALAILGGAFLANYLSEKLVGLLGGVLFLLFAAATLFGVF